MLLSVLAHPDGSGPVTWAERPLQELGYTRACIHTHTHRAQPPMLHQDPPNHTHTQLDVQGGTAGQRCPHILLPLHKGRFAVTGRHGELFHQSKRSDSGTQRCALNLRGARALQSLTRTCAHTHAHTEAHPQPWLSLSADGRLHFPAATFLSA